ncbi:glycosyltransferase [uncultured Psychroserpens sp.]|uniref:glycosyltransferase n=1 Tax=uncultured Psychroserpens sp. TaxID=255436 RepID=UPI0026250C49|nr:glycosyltransferase [uncultured Psychroserpens sp.]
MGKRLRILYTIPNFNTAGSGKVLYDLAKGLDKSKFDVEIACENRKGKFFEEVENLGLPIHIVKTKTPLKPYHSLFSRVWKIAKFYKQHDYDLVHSWQWSSDWTESLAARFAGCKWIYTKKAMGFKSKHWKIKSWLAHFIITINDDMQAYFPNKKAQKLIPLGIDTEYYSKQVRKESPTDTFHIITVANLVPVKGIEILIRAIGLVAEKNIKLTILGDDNNLYGDEMKQLSVDLKIDHLVTFLGKKLDVRPYMSEADLYVIPTLDEGRKEGMPMALVEAMSIGIPLLGSNISGINFVLRAFQDLLFEAGNVQALKEKIEYIMSLNTTEREQIGVSLRQYCIDHFSMEKFISAHEELYTQLITNKQ